jgi:hypothetical protein
MKLDYKVGDRVKLISMNDDPDPIPMGTKGTVIFAHDVSFSTTEKFYQIGVDWDNGRTLMVVVPPDRIMRI